jgi:hypothetical protein
MKKIVFLLVISLFSMNIFAQKEKWTALEDYHAIMSKTFHPAEEGNLKPVFENAASISKAATVLKMSQVPMDYQKPGVNDVLKKLEKESKSLAKMVRKGKSEAELKKAIYDLHDRFHEVMEVCNH